MLRIGEFPAEFVPLCLRKNAPHRARPRQVWSARARCFFYWPLFFYCRCEACCDLDKVVSPWLRWSCFAHATRESDIVSLHFDSVFFVPICFKKNMLAPKSFTRVAFVRAVDFCFNVFFIVVSVFFIRCLSPMPIFMRACTMYNVQCANLSNINSLFHVFAWQTSRVLLINYDLTNSSPPFFSRFDNGLWDSWQPQAPVPWYDVGGRLITSPLFRDSPRTPKGGCCPLAERCGHSNRWSISEAFSHYNYACSSHKCGLSDFLFHFVHNQRALPKVLSPFKFKATEPRWTPPPPCSNTLPQKNIAFDLTHTVLLQSETMRSNNKNDFIPWWIRIFILDTISGYFHSWEEWGSPYEYIVALSLSIWTLLRMSVCIFFYNQVFDAVEFLNMLSKMNTFIFCTVHFIAYNAIGFIVFLNISVF